MIGKPDFTEDDAKKVLADKKRRAEAKTVLEDEDKIEELLKNVVKSLDNIPIVGKFFADVPTLCLLVKDYVEGDYRAIPLASVITIVVALIYFVSPIDIIPDIIPGIGKLDDAIVIGIAVAAVHNDIADYKDWKGLDSEKVVNVRDLF